MRIAILGGGAMGSLFGGYLSAHNDVTIVDISEKSVDAINNGIRIKEKDGTECVYHPRAVIDSSSLSPQDLVIVFVKSMFTESALSSNKALIGKDTYLMTLQNGAGHERKLMPFQDESHIIIGSTQHNASIISSGYINHGGSGITSIGLLYGDSSAISHIAETFTLSCLECKTEQDVRKQIWKKLFTNTAASSLTALLQVPLGYIYCNRDAHEMMETLCKEAVAVASSIGLEFDINEVIRDVDNVLINAPNGYTSIYADIKAGRKTEVDTISGTVVTVARENGIPVPYHEMLVHAIHALEDRKIDK